MAVTLFASGTQTATVTTEHFLSSPNVAGKFVLQIDLVNMAAGDVVELRAYKMVLTGGTARVAYFAQFAGAQPTESLIAISEAISTTLTDATGLRFSLKQTFGTGRNFPWAVLNEEDFTTVPDVNVTKWLGTAAATPTVAGVPEVDVTHLVGVAQSATDLKDFADDGYDPATNKVQGVVLTDTLTTNSDKTGYAIGAGGIAAAAFAAGAVDAAAIAANAIGASEIADGAIDAATFAAGAIDNAAFNVTETLTANPATGGIVAGSFGASAIDAAALATDAVNEIRDSVFARAFSAAYGSYTFDEMIKMFSAVLLAKASGLATTTATYRNPADSADVVVATVDADGNRSAVTRTP